jgi:hypothetical protein
MKKRSKREISGCTKIFLHFLTTNLGFHGRASAHNYIRLFSIFTIIFLLLSLKSVITTKKPVVTIAPMSEQDVVNLRAFKDQLDSRYWNLADGFAIFKTVFW